MQFDERYGSWAVIAGASTGLGAAFGHEAARRGLNVVLVARRAATLEEAAAAIRATHSVEVRTVALDLGHAHAADELARMVNDLDVGLLVYNAAAEPQGRFLDTPLEDLHLNIAVNCTTPTVLLKHLAPRMVRRERGGVVLVSSMGALQGIKVFVDYGAAKSYELILGEGLWDELRDHGVDAFAYVVGAPRSPDEVAGTCFSLLDRRDDEPIRPRHYSHPDDEARALADATRPRADVVAQMGRSTSAMQR